MLCCAWDCVVLYWVVCVGLCWGLRWGLYCVMLGCVGGCVVLGCVVLCCVGLYCVELRWGLCCVVLKVVLRCGGCVGSFYVGLCCAGLLSCAGLCVGLGWLSVWCWCEGPARSEVAVAAVVSYFLFCAFQRYWLLLYLPLKI